MQSANRLANRSDINIKRLNENKILLVGCGNMMSALLGSWLSSGINPKNITAIVASENSAKEKSEKFGIRCLTSQDKASNSILAQTDILIFAVKPQNLTKIISDYKDNNAKIIISIIAGRNCKFFRQYFPDLPIIRTMPNMAAMHGKSVTSGFALEASDEEKSVVENLFSLAGKFFWLEKEDDMHDATAIAGSGSAFFLQFLIDFQEAACELGIDKNLAKELAIETAKISFLSIDNKNSPQSLIDKIASKGGTTEAGLAELKKEKQLQNLLRKTLQAAKEKSISVADNENH